MQDEPEGVDSGRLNTIDEVVADLSQPHVSSQGMLITNHENWG